MKDILIACIDGLKGFSKAIEPIFPRTELQHGIVHQMRNSIKHVASKYQRGFIADLKYVYKATTLNAAELALNKTWNDKYPMVIKSWRTKWPTLSSNFKYPGNVRKAIYATNVSAQ